MIRNRINPDSQTPTGGVVNRVLQFIGTLVGQIVVSKGGILLGKETGKGFAEEITVGDGLSLEGGVLSADAVTSIEKSLGGNGAADAGKVAEFSNIGGLAADSILVQNWAGQGFHVGKTVNTIEHSNGINTTTLSFSTPTANSTITVPAKSGTMAMTSDIVSFEGVPSTVESLAPKRIDIALSTLPAGDGTLYSVGLVNLRHKYTTDGEKTVAASGIWWSVEYNGTEWSASLYNDGVSQGTIQADPGSEYYPWDAEGWDNVGGTFTIVDSSVAADFKGQFWFFGAKPNYTIYQQYGETMTDWLLVEDMSGYQSALALAASAVQPGTTLSHYGITDAVRATDRRHDFVSPYDYNGKAAVGSSEASAVWTIKRISTAGVTTTATGVAWTNRLTATYT